MLLSLHLPPKWKHEHLEETDSTMTRIAELPTPLIPEGGATLITADYQTQGHGQKGSHWEAACGANLLFSFAFCPQKVEAHEQFFLSEALALAVAETLQPLIGECKVKWPNDVYWHDRKICGMLLQHTLCGGCIARTNVGVGINVNQKEFESDAPNPVSVCQIVCHEVERWPILESILGAFERNLSLIQQGDTQQLHDRYMNSLYRGTGLHTFRDAAGHTFEAAIAHISPLGLLTLQLNNGTQRTFAFKEVSYVLP